MIDRTRPIDPRTGDRATRDIHPAIRVLSALLLCLLASALISLIGLSL